MKASDRLQSRWALAGVIAVGLLLQSRSLTVFFHHDDLEILESMTAAPEPWRWVLERHVDHLPVVRSALYLAFLRLFGPTATPWHFLLLFLHGGSAAMLGALLRRLGCSPVAQLFAVGTFAASTAFHECVYWVAASTFSLALFFCLAALLSLARAEDARRWPWILVAGVFSLLALLSASIAAVLPFLGFLLAWALPGGNRTRRLAVFVAVPALALGLLALLLALSPSDAAARLGGSARDSFDPLGGAILAVRGFVERLAGRYFTGGTLPWPLALLLVLALVAAAGLRRRPEAPPAAVSALAPILWILGSSFTALAFRTWLGDVVFVSRYQLFPAVGFAWLVALAIDGILDRAAHLGPSWPTRAVRAVLGFALPAVLAMNAYAHKVCQERWLARTEPLQRAHEAIAKGLRDLSAEARRGPVEIRDHLVGGGSGYRPSLRGMSAYLLRKDERDLLRFTDDSAAPLHPSLVPLVSALREGRGSWLEWLDDLAISDAAKGADLGSPVGLLTLFPRAERVQVEPLSERKARLKPLGQGQIPVLGSGPRDDLPRWETLSFRAKSDGLGEILVVFMGPDLPDLGRGARIRLRPNEERHVVVDVPLGTRGRRASAREVEIRLVNELASYEIADVALRVAPSP